MTVPICLEMPAPPALPELEIPQFGILAAARQSLYDLPDASVFIVRMQEVASLALAPLRRYLEMVEIILAIKSCQEAVINALLPPSPGPILDCLKDLVRAIARITSYFPPFSYVKSMLSLCRYIVNTIDEAISLFVFLDQRLAEYQAVLANALELGDLDLASISDCAGTEVIQLTVNLMDMLDVVPPLLRILLEPIARLVPIPQLRDELSKITDFPAQLAQLRQTIEATQGPPVIGDLVQLMNNMRNAGVILYNTLSPVVGRDPELTTRTLPEFQVL